MTEAIALVTYSEVTEYPSPHLKCKPRGRKERVCISVSAGIPCVSPLPAWGDGWLRAVLGHCGDSRQSVWPFLSLNHILSTVLKDTMNTALTSVTLKGKGSSQDLMQETIFTHQGQNSYTNKSNSKRWYFRNPIKSVFSTGIWDVIKQVLVNLFCYVSFVNRQGHFFLSSDPPHFYFYLFGLHVKSRQRLLSVIVFLRIHQEQRSFGCIEASMPGL